MAQNRYIDFMTNEGRLANEEMQRYRSLKEVANLCEMISVKAPPKDIREYIRKNISFLMNYAPHLTMQIYLATIVASNEQYRVESALKELLDNEELPAKSFSVINGYLSILKEREETPPDMSFASDEKILELLNSISPENLSSLMICIQTRIQTGTKPDYFVGLLNPFMESETTDPVYKVSLLQQFTALALSSPCTLPFRVRIENKVYPVVCDGSLDLSTDIFLRMIKYYGKSLNLPEPTETTLETFASLYRVVHYNEKSVLNTEMDIKSFVQCFVEGYNRSMSPFGGSSPQSNIPPEYRSAKGYREASSFMRVVFHP